MDKERVYSISQRFAFLVIVLLGVLIVIDSHSLLATWYANQGNAHLAHYMTSQPEVVAFGLAELPWSPSAMSRTAVSSYTRALALDPQDMSASAGLGLLALVTGDKAVAVNRLRAALAFRPQFVGLFLGQALYSSGRSREAAQVWREGGAIALLIRQGQALRSDGFLNEAVVRFQQATLAFPDRIEPWLELAVTYRSQGDNERAVATFEQALQIDPTNVQANLGIAGVLLRDRANARRALPYAQAALGSLGQQSDPSDIDLGSAYALMGMISVYEENDSEGIEWYRKAVALPEYPRGRICVELARIYQRRGEVGEFRQSVNCGLAATAELVQGGNIHQAVLDYRLILSVDPTNPTALLELERLSTRVEREGG